MKFAVSSYSYAQLTGSGKKTESDLIPLAKEMGFDAIEFAEIHPPEGIDKLEYAAKLSELCSRVGIEVANYAIGADFVNRPLEEEVTRLYNEVKVAKALGSPQMRHDTSSGYSDRSSHKGFETALPLIVEGCALVTRFAAAHGIRTMTENHGFFCQESARVERIITGVNEENFGSLIDVGNFLCADDEPAAAVGRLAPYVFHVHVKDFHVKSGMGPNPGRGWFQSRAGNYLRGAIIGHGNVPVYQCLSVLRHAGYDGYLTVEFEGMEDCVKGVGIGLKNLKAMVESL